MLVHGVLSLIGRGLGTGARRVLLPFKLQLLASLGLGKLVVRGRPASMVMPLACSVCAGLWLCLRLWRVILLVMLLWMMLCWCECSVRGSGCACPRWCGCISYCWLVVAVVGDKAVHVDVDAAD